jgi:ABC-type phosphate/phosphonate transport system, permease component
VSGIQFLLYPDAAIVKNVPEATQEYEIKRDEQGRPYVVGFQDRPEDLPDWIRATENRVEVRPSLWERMQVYGRKIEIHRYSFGWNYFWFDFASPLANVGPLEAIGLMFDDHQVVPGTPNYELVATEFWNNSLWQHGIIFVALFETLLMAVLGTAIAAMLGLPLAFLAARNVSPFPVVRFINRRLFDLLRGIDMLIWSLIFLRAFGPGLFTGIFAIGFTDTGSLGKLMSEAIENADRKQVDGMKSTGASKLQQHRFGIIPQILPIFVSQSLYYLESNTRSA